jgi:thiol-disulfide isomerase/thioredoxin
MFKKTLLFIFFFYLSVFASYPDTLIIKMTKHKGLGPFRMHWSQVKEMSPNNSWRSCVPQIKGIADTLDRFMFATMEVDFLQHTYQNYYMGNITMAKYMDLQESWDWPADSSQFTKKFVKVNIAVTAGIDKKGQTVVVIDRNNNYDLSDDPPYIIPPKIKGQKFPKRYNDSLLIKVDYSYYDGKSILKDSTWLYVDHDLFTYNLADSLLYDTPVALTYAFREYRTGAVKLNGQEYIIYTSSSRPIGRNYTHLMLQTGKDRLGNPLYSDEINHNEKVEIGDAFYRFKDIMQSGKYIMLTKVSDAESRKGSQVGFYTPDFSAKTFNNEEIKLKEYKGKYVLLDFWGTWCGPCIAEIPHLKRIYEKYAGKNFAIIGIANDTKAKVADFVQRKNIPWPQIIQDDSKEILKLYNIQGYPTIFLIDPEGKIIEKNIRSAVLDERLEELLD